MKKREGKILVSGPSSKASVRIVREYAFLRILDKFGFWQGWKNPVDWAVVFHMRNLPSKLRDIRACDNKLWAYVPSEWYSPPVNDKNCGR